MNARFLNRLPLIVICVAVCSIIATPFFIKWRNRNPDETSKACRKRDDTFAEYTVSQDISLVYQPLSAVIDNEANTVIVGGTSTATALDIFSLEDENEFPLSLDVSFGNFHALALNESADLLVGGTSNGSTVVWQRDSTSETGWTQNATKLPEGLSEMVSSVAISRDGNLISASSKSGNLLVWGKDKKTGEWQRERNTFAAHRNGILDVAFDDAGRLLSAGDDSQIKFWEPVGNSKALFVYGTRSNVDSVVLYGEIIVAGLRNGEIEVWDTNAQQNSETTPPRDFELHSMFVKSLAVSIEENLLVSGSNDSKVQVWGFCTQSKLQTFTEHSDRVNSVDISEEGDVIVSTGIDKRLIIRTR